MIVNKKINLEGVDPNSLKNGIKTHSLSVQISIAFFRRALHFFKQKRYIECISALDCTIKYDIFNSIFYSFKGLVLGIILGKFDYAIEEVEKALLLNPHSKNAYELRKELLRLQFNDNNYNYFI